MSKKKKLGIFLIIVGVVLILFILFWNSKNQTRIESIPALSTGETAAVATVKPIDPAVPQKEIPVLGVGKVSRHTKDFINQKVRIAGYLIRKEAAYAIISDENYGPLGYYDLPVSGVGFDTILSKHKYILEGTLVLGKIKAINGNPYRLQLSSLPTLVK